MSALVSSFYPVRHWNRPTCPPLPTRSAITQCSSLCCILQRVAQSVPPGEARTPAESPASRSRACLEGSRCQPSQQAFALFRSEPITNRHTQPLGTLYPANTGRQVCAEQTAISSLVGQSPDCSQTQVDGR